MSKSSFKFGWKYDPEYLKLLVNVFLMFFLSIILSPVSSMNSIIISLVQTSPSVHVQACTFKISENLHNMSVIFWQQFQSFYITEVSFPFKDIKDKINYKNIHLELTLRKNEIEVIANMSN